MYKFKLLVSLFIASGSLFNQSAYADDQSTKGVFFGVKLSNFPPNNESWDSGSVWKADALSKIYEIRKNDACVKDIIDATLDAFESPEVINAFKESLTQPSIHDVALYLNFWEPNSSGLCAFKQVRGEVVINASLSVSDKLIVGQYPNFSVNKSYLITEIRRLTAERLKTEQQTDEKFKNWEVQRSSLAKEDPFFDRIPRISRTF
jgi:hypothetical protein